MAPKLRGFSWILSPSKYFLDEAEVKEKRRESNMTYKFH